MVSPVRCIISIFVFQVCLVSCREYKEDGKKSCPEPRIGRRISDVLVEPFQIASVALPQDAFTGSEYTVSLSISSPTTKCWFKFEPLTRTLHLLVDRDVTQSQPAGGYVFKLTAVSTCGSKTVSQTFHVKSQHETQVSCMDIQIDMQVLKKDPNACALEIMNEIILRTRSYLSHSTGPQQVICQLQEYNLRPDGYLRYVLGFKVARLSQCQELCDQNFFATFSKRIVSEFGQINQKFVALLGSRYTVYSAHASIGCKRRPTEKPVTQNPRSSTPHCFPPSINSRIKDIRLASAFRPFITALPSNIFDNQQDLKLSLHLVGHVSSGDRSICWVRFSSHTIYSFPTNHTVARKPNGGYRYALTAVNKCGLSSSVEFNIDIGHIGLKPCFLFETVLDHPQNLCEESILKEFYDALRWRVDYAKYGELFVTEIRGFSLQRSIVRYMITRPNQNNCHCSEDALPRLKQLFSSKNLNKLFTLSSVIKSIKGTHFLDGPSRCGKSCGEEKRIISQTARAGIVNELVLPVNSAHKYTLSKKHENNQHVCLVNRPQTSGTALLFLPPKQVGPHYGLKNHKFHLVKESSPNCQITVDIHASPLVETPCYHITMRFILLKPYPCLLQAVNEMVQDLSKFYRVRTDQIIILQYSAGQSKDSKNTEVSMLFTFTHDVIACSKCSIILLKTFVNQIIRKDGSVSTEFNLLIAQRFKVLNMSYLVFTNSGLTGILDFSNHSQSYIPLWVYMLPLFLMLLVVLLFLLSCCFCCRGRRNGTNNTLSSWSTCCLCCVPGDSRSRKRRRVYSTASYPSVYHVSTSGRQEGAGEKNSLTKYHSSDSINSIYLKGIGGGHDASSSKGGNNKTETAVSIPIEPAPAHGEQNTKLIYAQVYKSRKNKVEATKSSNEDEENPYTPPLTHRNTRRSSAEERTPGTYALNREARLDSSKRSTRVRSFSDGYLLDDDYLDLPTPPPARRCRDDSTIRRRYSRRVSHRYCRDDSALGNHKEKVRITIPVKITARVKSISKSLDDGLDTIRPSSSSYVRFADPVEESPSDRKTSKYESNSVFVETQTPLSRRTKYQPNYNFTSKSSSSSNGIGAHSNTRHKRMKSLDPEDEDFTTYKKTVERQTTKRATTKRYPWESEDFWRKSTKESSDIQSPRYPWRNSNVTGETSNRSKDADLFTTSSTTRKNVKFGRTDDRYTEV